jgi:hypothetical protein
VHAKDPRVADGGRRSSPWDILGSCSGGSRRTRALCLQRPDKTDRRTGVKLRRRSAIGHKAAGYLPGPQPQKQAGSEVRLRDPGVLEGYVRFRVAQASKPEHDASARMPGVRFFSHVRCALVCRCSLLLLVACPSHSRSSFCYAIRIGRCKARMTQTHECACTHTPTRTRTRHGYRRPPRGVHRRWQLGKAGGPRKDHEALEKRRPCKASIAGCRDLCFSRCRPRRVRIVSGRTRRTGKKNSSAIADPCSTHAR